LTKTGRIFFSKKANPSAVSSAHAVVFVAKYAMNRKLAMVTDFIEYVLARNLVSPQAYRRRKK
jgi:hypothetical protein